MFLQALYLLVNQILFSKWHKIYRRLFHGKFLLHLFLLELVKLYVKIKAKYFMKG